MNPYQENTSPLQARIRPYAYAAQCKDLPHYYLKYIFFWNFIFINHCDFHLIEHDADLLYESEKPDHN